MRSRCFQILAVAGTFFLLLKGASVAQNTTLIGLDQAIDMDTRLMREDGGAEDTCFMHGDFQHFNFLWTRGRLTGVVDWGSASTGSPSIDVGHCRLNLAVLFGADWAERFRLAYQAETGRSVDPWRDLQALAGYGDAWRRFIPVQVNGRVPVDTGGMTARVEEVLAAALQRV